MSNSSSQKPRKDSCIWLTCPFMGRPSACHEALAAIDYFGSRAQQTMLNFRVTYTQPPRLFGGVVASSVGYANPLKRSQLTALEILQTAGTA